MGKEELAEQLHEVLPSPEMAKSAGVPYKRKLWLRSLF